MHSAAEVCGRLFKQSSLEVIGIDNDELGLYLSFPLTATALLDRSLYQSCPTRVTFRGRALSFTASGQDNRRKKKLEIVEKDCHYR